MTQLAIVIRDLPYLKLLYPICEQFYSIGISFNIYHWDAPRGEKEYLRTSINNIKKSSPKIISWAKNIKSFSNDKQLYKQLKADKISKLVSVELGLWLNKKAVQDIKTYSVQYLTDSLWKPNVDGLTKVYYSSKYLMNIHHKFSNTKCLKNRDKFLGSPVFDSISNKPGEGKDILVLMPNIRKEHIQSTFGNTKQFIDIINKISHGNNLIFKTRKKQWIPNEIKKYAKDIVSDGDIMYPTIISDLLKRCYCTVMFFSSGIYECVYGGNYIYNITFPLKRWNWDKNKMKEYFSTIGNSVYQFPGVVESVDQNTFLGNWKFEPRNIDPIMMEKWIDKYIGPKLNGSKLISEDILYG